MVSKYGKIQAFANEDYSNYSKTRDKQVAELLNNLGSSLHLYKDSAIFPELVNPKTNSAYKVFTYYKTEWLSKLDLNKDLKDYSNSLFGKSDTESFDEFITSKVFDYHKSRDQISQNGTSRISHLLKFGIISIHYIVREIVQIYLDNNLNLQDFRTLKLSKFAGVESFLSEIIWREFYKTILNNYPEVSKVAFQEKFRDINWHLNFDDVIWENEVPKLKDNLKLDYLKIKAFDNFVKFINSETGFEIVDAAISQLNSESWMHNRCRMIVASFLVKDLHIDWRLGEYYFKLKLLDFDLASNNGGWQWSAGVGTDAAPYFRIFNPDEQAEKFDPARIYRNKYLKKGYNPEKIIDHKSERLVTLDIYKL